MTGNEKGIYSAEAESQRRRKTTLPDLGEQPTGTTTKNCTGVLASQIRWMPGERTWGQVLGQGVLPAWSSSLWKWNLGTPAADEGEAPRKVG